MLPLEVPGKGGNMIFWLLVAIALALLGVVEILVGFSIPFTSMRTIILLLLVMGMGYRMYSMEKSGEKEDLKQKIRDLQNQLTEKEIAQN
jgi:hypothetical protein